MKSETYVRAHTRRPPEKKPDPLAPEMEARRAALEKRWAPTLAQIEASKRIHEFRDEIGYVPWWRRLFGRHG